MAFVHTPVAKPGKVQSPRKLPGTPPSGSKQPLTGTLDPCQTFIKRPHAKRRSIDIITSFKNGSTYIYLHDQPTGTIIYDMMMGMEQIPEKMKEYPQLRKDIKSFIEQKVDSSLAALCELSQRLQEMEKKAPLPQTAPQSNTDMAITTSHIEAIMKKLGELEDGITLANENICEAHKDIKENTENIDSELEDLKQEDATKTKLLDAIETKIEVIKMSLGYQDEDLDKFTQEPVKDCLERLVEELHKSNTNVELSMDKHSSQLEVIDKNLNITNTNVCKSNGWVHNFEENQQAIKKGVDNVLTQTEDIKKLVTDDRTEVNKNGNAHLADKIDHIKRVVETVQARVEQADQQPTAVTLGSKPTYAAVASTPKYQPTPALHSIAVTSEDATETSAEVLDRVKRAVDAKKEGIRVEKIRKAKNQKVIIGCRSRQDLDHVVDRIEKKGEKLKVTKIANKDPLVLLKDVLLDDDETIVAAVLQQNKNIFEDLSDEETRLKIKYKKRTRNPMAAHMVMQVSPMIWHRMVAAGALHIDLQRVRVEDQSPLIQCSRCLAYGHGRKYCTHDADKCSHCGGPHLRAECELWIAGSPPECCNCTRSGLKEANHSAYSDECPVRRKWDYLARSTTAYYTE